MIDRLWWVKYVAGPENFFKGLRHTEWFSSFDDAAAREKALKQIGCVNVRMGSSRCSEHPMHESDLDQVWEYFEEDR